MFVLRIPVLTFLFSCSCPGSCGCTKDWTGDFLCAATGFVAQNWVCATKVEKYIYCFQGKSSNMRSCRSELPKGRCAEALDIVVSPCGYYNCIFLVNNFCRCEADFEASQLTPTQNQIITS